MLTHAFPFSPAIPPLAASMSFMMAQTYADFHPNSNAKPYIWASAAIYPAIVGWMRVKAGKHFPTDVIVGYLAGAAVGMLVPRIHRKN